MNLKSFFVTATSVIPCVRFRRDMRDFADRLGHQLNDDMRVRGERGAEALTAPAVFELPDGAYNNIRPLGGDQQAALVLSAIQGDNGTSGAAIGFCVRNFVRVVEQRGGRAELISRASVDSSLLKVVPAQHLALGI